MWITAPQMRRFAPNAKAATVDALLLGHPWMDQAGINTPRRVQHFMAQIAHESGGFTIGTENLNYSALRLTQVWPSHFPTIAAAQPYANAPERLANYIYADANRSPGYRLGNTQPGDGWRYRGRGLIQTTGRDNYRKIGHEDDPETLADPEVGLRAAIDEWTRTGCNALADRDDIAGITRKINGGQIGLADRKAWLAKAKKIFVPSADDLPPVLPEPAIPAARPRDYEELGPIPVRPPDVPVTTPSPPTTGGFFDALRAAWKRLFL